MSKIHICRNGVWYRVDSMSEFYTPIVYKPRLRRCAGLYKNLWKCVSENGIIGYGYSPEEAYGQWNYWENYLNPTQKQKLTRWQRLKNWFKGVKNV